MRFDTCSPRLLRHLSGSTSIVVHDRYRGAFPGERPDGGPADPGCTTRHDRHLADKLPYPTCSPVLDDSAVDMTWASSSRRPG